MVDFKQIFLKCDMFAFPFEIKFKGKKFFESWLGVILTIMTIGFCVAIGLSSGSQVIDKIKPRVNVNNLFRNIPENYTLNTNEVPFTFSIGTPSKVNNFIDPRYYVVTVQHYMNVKFTDTKGTVITNRTRDNLEYELCGNNPEKYLSRFSVYGNFTDALYLDSFDSHLCVKNANITLGGNFKTPFFSNIRLQVQRCVNSTLNNNHCMPSDVIDKHVQSENLSFNFIHTLPDTNNYTFPYQASYFNYFMKLDTKTSKFTDVYFARTNVTSDTGFLFEDLRWQGGWKYDYYREVVQVAMEDNIIARIYFNIGQNQIEITRFYMKVPDVIALVGGILKVCTTLGIALTTFFQQFMFEEELINLYFDYESISTEDQRNIKPIIGSDTIKMVNLTASRMKQIDENVFNDKNEQNKKKKMKKSNLDVEMKNKQIDENSGEDNIVLSTKKTNFQGMNKKGEEVNYNLNYCDVIKMTICPCTRTGKALNYTHENLQSALFEYTDYKEVINEIIGFRHFKEYIISNDIDISKDEKKVRIDFNPYKTDDNKHLNIFIKTFQKLVNDKMLNEKITKEMFKLLKKENRHV